MLMNLFSFTQYVHMLWETAILCLLTFASCEPVVKQTNASFRRWNILRRSREYGYLSTVSVTGSRPVYEKTKPQEVAQIERFFGTPGIQHAPHRFLNIWWFSTIIWNFLFQGWV